MTFRVHVETGDFARNVVNLFIVDDPGGTEVTAWDFTHTSRPYAPNEVLNVPSLALPEDLARALYYALGRHYDHSQPVLRMLETTDDSTRAELAAQLATERARTDGLIETISTIAKGLLPKQSPYS